MGTTAETTTAAGTRPGPGLGLTWSLRGRGPEDVPVLGDPGPPGGHPAGPATGRGVRVCVVDSGVERDHPLVGEPAGSWVVVKDAESGEITVEPTTTGDTCGHGTACAGIIRQDRAGVRDPQRPGARRAVLRHGGHPDGRAALGGRGGRSLDRPPVGSAGSVLGRRGVQDGDGRPVDVLGPERSSVTSRTRSPERAARASALRTSGLSPRPVTRSASDWPRTEPTAVSRSSVV
ncbi:hypothetical protein SMICM304S_01272 [Streptomyces microflavus]